MKLPKAIWFGFSCIAIVVMLIVFLTPWTAITTGHIGLIMLALIVVAIMLGFPTAFTLMGMGVIFTFLAYILQAPEMTGQALNQTLTLMVQRTYATMTNDALISIPLFVFMGYLVERANLIETLFRSLHLALARLPGALAVATLVTCAIFATATGIVGAVVTLMGLLAIRLDRDVVKFFRSMGLGYGPRINRVLRTYMHARLAGVIRGPETAPQFRMAMTGERPRCAPPSSTSCSAAGRSTTRAGRRSRTTPWPDRSTTG